MLQLLSLCSHTNPSTLQEICSEDQTLLRWWEYCRFSNRHTLRNTRKCNVRSKIRWFTEFCNSHYLSHFAAFFIVARAKRSVVKSCFINCIFFSFSLKKRKKGFNFRQSLKKIIGLFKSLGRMVFFKHTNASKKERILKNFRNWGPKHKLPRINQHCYKTLFYGVHNREDNTNIGNDPTAGSPTVTLLRLLLPLNDQVWPASQHFSGVAA